MGSLLCPRLVPLGSVLDLLRDPGVLPGAEKLRAAVLGHHGSDEQPSDPARQAHLRRLVDAFDAFFPRGRHQAYWKSTYLDELSDAAVDVIAEKADTRPSDNTLLNLLHLGGEASRVGADETAFGDRSARFLLSIDGNWDHAVDNDANVGWVRDTWEELQAHARGVYLNFLGDEDRGSLVRLAHGVTDCRSARGSADGSCAARWSSRVRRPARPRSGAA